MADEIVASLHAAAPIEPGRPARYPGEQTLRLREENLRLGIPVDEAIWQQILKL
jgi:3-dehydro-L-gulonate 2-dehydrogenase